MSAVSLWSRAVRHIAAGRACSSGSASVTRVLPSAYQTTRLASTSAAAGPSTPPEIRGGGKVRRSPSPKARRHHGDKTGPSSTQNRAVPSDRTDERPVSRKRLSGFSKPKSNRRGGISTTQSRALPSSFPPPLAILTRESQVLHPPPTAFRRATKMPLIGRSRLP